MTKAATIVATLRDWGMIFRNMVSDFTMQKSRTGTGAHAVMVDTTNKAINHQLGRCLGLLGIGILGPK